ncbi:hypothetical protein HQ34_03220 [Porphyromonas cangingivalis]|nr:hypothetical protein HQ34_03220 [Porphyromonas cangingivalis]
MQNVACCEEQILIPLEGEGFGHVGEEDQTVRVLRSCPVCILWANKKAVSKLDFSTLPEGSEFLR